MRVRGRTIVLTFVVIQLCLEYSVLYESVKSLNGPVQLTVFDIGYPHLFDVLLTIILIIAMLLNLQLFLYGLKGHTKRKKNFVIYVFAFHCIIAIPYFISGLYLYSSAIASETSKLSQDFVDLFMGVQKLLNFSKIPVVSFKQVMRIQKSYCCCGLEGPEHWGLQFKDVHNASLKFKGLIFSCPRPESHNDHSCKFDSFEGCAPRITRIKRYFIFVASMICLCCAIIALIISPCIYAVFEHDRRVARAAHIRLWRKNLEFELDKERREDYENEMSSAVRRAAKHELIVQPTQSSSEHATQTERTEKERDAERNEKGRDTEQTEKERDAAEEVLSRRTKTSRTGSGETSAATKKGKKINGSERERLLSGKSGKSSKRVMSMYADARLYP
ncbi:hypothetical protein Aduo_015065 [Ancylostoma duodenale]